jgi:hypothetical protein
VVSGSSTIAGNANVGSLTLGGIRGGVRIEIGSGYTTGELEPSGGTCSESRDLVCGRWCPAAGGGAIGKYVSARGGGQCGIWKCGCYALTGTTPSR